MPHSINIQKAEGGYVVHAFLPVPSYNVTSTNAMEIEQEPESKLYVFSTLKEALSFVEKSFG